MEKEEKQTKTKCLDTIYDKMSMEYNIPKENVSSVLRNTAFRMADSKVQVNDAEMVALLSVAEKHQLNPFTREIYAFRSKSGIIIPVVSIDGWIRKMNEHKRFKGFELDYSEKMIKIGKMNVQCYDWVEVKIYISEKEHPVIIREYLDECYNGYTYDKSPWNTHPKRMLRHKTIIQGARLAFNLSGIYDYDEAERIDINNAPEEIPEMIDPEKNITEKKDVKKTDEKKPVIEEKHNTITHEIETTQQAIDLF